MMTELGELFILLFKTMNKKRWNVAKIKLWPEYSFAGSVQDDTE